MLFAEATAAMAATARDIKKRIMTVYMYIRLKNNDRMFK